MSFDLQNIQPNPLADRQLAASDIWLQNIHFKPGQYYHISAPSGTGKTTLAHILFGLRTDYTGSLFFESAEIQSHSINRWCDIRQKQISIVFQDLRLFPALTALENIELKAMLTKTTHQAEIDEMAEQLGLHKLLSQTCQTLSQGEKQRIAIIRALSQPFQWIILDEPFSHLDEENTRLAADLILRYAQRKNAGLIALQLSDDNLFPYHQKLHL